MDAKDHRLLRALSALARAKGALEVAGEHYKCAATQSEARAAGVALDSITERAFPLIEDKGNSIFRSEHDPAQEQSS